MAQNPARPARRDREPKERNYAFVDHFTGAIDLGQLASFGRIDFEPRLYGSPRPGPEPDVDDGSDWRRYGAPGQGDSGANDLLERLDATGFFVAMPDGRPPALGRDLPAPSDAERYLRGRSGRDLPALADVERAARGRSGRDLSDDAPSRVESSGKSKALWTLTDQVISSGTNAVISFLIAGQVSKSQYGAFAIAFTLYALVVGFSRAAGTSPLSMKFSDTTRGEFRRAGKAATGTAMTLGFVAGGLLAGAGVVLRGPTGAALLAMGVVLPGLLVQDAWRYVFFSQGRARSSALNDALWAVVQLGAIGVLLHRHVHSSPQLLLAWGGSALVAAAFGAAQAGFVPKPSAVRAWVAEHRDVSGYMSAEYITVQGAQQASTLLVGAIGSIVVVGALRGVQTLLGPTTILAVGMISFAIPEFSRRTDLTAGARLKAAYALSALVAGMGALWGAIFLVLPPSIGQSLLGDTWPETHKILIGSIVQQAGAAASVGPASMLYALRQARVTFRIHVLLAPMILIGSVGGLELGGAQGVVWGYAIAFWSLVPMWFIRLRKAAMAADAARDAPWEPDDDAGSGAGRDGGPDPYADYGDYYGSSDDRAGQDPVEVDDGYGRYAREVLRDDPRRDDTALIQFLRSEPPTFEPPRREPPRREPPRREPPRREPPRREPPRPAPVRPEPVRPDPVRPEPARQTWAPRTARQAEEIEEIPDVEIPHEAVPPEDVLDDEPLDDGPLDDEPLDDDVVVILDRITDLDLSDRPLRRPRRDL